MGGRGPTVAVNTSHQNNTAQANNDKLSLTSTMSGPTSTSNVEDSPPRPIMSAPVASESREAMDQRREVQIQVEEHAGTVAVGGSSGSESEGQVDAHAETVATDERSGNSLEGGRDNDNLVERMARALILGEADRAEGDAAVAARSRRNRALPAPELIGFAERA